MKHNLYTSTLLPAMQNVLFPNREQALNAPRAELNLVLDPSGYVFNSAFNPNLVEYNSEYQNDQGHSPAFGNHLSAVIQYCKHFCPNPKGLIVDVGCGKGGFVDLMRSQGLNAVGYDNTYEGNSKYIRKSFFNSDSHDRGDLLTLRHVLEHVQNPWDFIRDLADANGRKGLLYIEVPDLIWILENHAYYDLFHEHVNYFCARDFRRCFPEALKSTISLFNGQYLGIVLDLSLIPSSNFAADISTNFHESLQRSFDSLVQHERTVYANARLSDALVVWGGASKGVVFAAKAPEDVLGKISFAIDINPNKSHKYMPVSGLQVLPPQKGLELLRPNDTVLIVNPNYEKEIVSSLPSGQPHFVLR